MTTQKSDKIFVCDFCGMPEMMLDYTLTFIRFPIYETGEMKIYYSGRCAVLDGRKHSEFKAVHKPMNWEGVKHAKHREVRSLLRRKAVMDRS